MKGSVSPSVCTKFMFGLLIFFLLFVIMIMFNF